MFFSMVIPCHPHTLEYTLERDFFMSASEAQEFGVVDEVITTRPDAVDGL